jgi:hypothetical protein
MPRSRDRGEFDGTLGKRTGRRQRSAHRPLGAPGCATAPRLASAAVLAGGGPRPVFTDLGPSEKKAPAVGPGPEFG